MEAGSCDSSSQRLERSIPSIESRETAEIPRIYDGNHAVEVEPIGETGAVVFTTRSKSNGRIPKPSISTGRPMNPDLHPLSPTVGYLPRSFVGGMGGENPSPLLLNPLDSDGKLRVDMADSAMQERNANNTLEQKQLIGRLSEGMPLTLHDGKTSMGTPVILSVVNDHSLICVSLLPSAGGDMLASERTVTVQSDPPTPQRQEKQKLVTDVPCTPKSQRHILPMSPHQPSISLPEGNEVFGAGGHTKYFLPLNNVVHLDVGKNSPSILTDPCLDHIHPMTCFSLIFSVGEGHTASLDLEARSAIDRDTIVSAFLIILESAHEAANESSDKKENNIPRPYLPDVLENENGDARDLGIKRESCILEPPSNSSSNKHIQQPHLADVQTAPFLPRRSLHMALSPQKRTHIHKSSILVPSNTTCTPKTPTEEGTETSLASDSSKIHNSPTSGHKLAMPSLGKTNGQLLSGHPPVPNLKRKHASPPGLIDATKVEDVSVADQLILPKSKIVPSAQSYQNLFDIALQDLTEACANILNCIDDAGHMDTQSGILFDTTRQCADPVQLFGCGNESQLFAKRKEVESYIQDLLSSSSQMASSLHEGNIWSRQEPIGKNPSESHPEEHKRKIQNRATVLHAQARRLRQLQTEMTFFISAKGSSRDMHWIQTTKSLDTEDNGMADIFDSATAGAGTIHSKAPLLDVSTATPAADSGDSMLSAGSILDFLGKPLVGAREVSKEEDSNLFYDSDPGEMKIRTSRSSRRAVAKEFSEMEGERSRLIQNEISMPAVELDHKQWTTKNALSAYEEPRTELFRGPEKEQRLGIHDVSESFVTSFVREMTNGTMTLLWHPTQDEHNTNRSPICVKAWIELGSRLQDSFVQPKLMWNVAYEHGLNRKTLNISRQRPEFLQLLDICRILDTHTRTIDRKLHPLANKNTSFVIETSNEIFLFEAKSVCERDHFVYGLKLVVARLASQLIVGDMQVYEEFYTPGGAQVPGEAPSWVTGEATIHRDV